MIPAIVTVVTPAAWEANLVAAARATGLGRVIGRCLDAEGVEARLDRTDAVVIGSEVPWLTAPLVRRWRSRRVTVVGMADPADRSAFAVLARAGCDPIWHHHEPPVRVLASSLAARRPSEEIAEGRALVVTGPRGAPGRSEVAFALAWSLAPVSRVALMELDDRAPSLSLRAGFGPSSGLPARDPALLGRPFRARLGELELIAARPGAGPLGPSVVTRVMAAARARFDLVVTDPGPEVPANLDDEPILVCSASPIGLVRAAAMTARWTGAQPHLVLNRVSPDAQEEAVIAARRATGLDPVTVIPEDPGIVLGEPPSPVFRQALAPLVDHLLSRDQRAAL